jgi:hypothetical protein
VVANGLADVLGLVGSRDRIGRPLRRGLRSEQSGETPAPRRPASSTNGRSPTTGGRAWLPTSRCTCSRSESRPWRSRRGYARALRRSRRAPRPGLAPDRRDPVSRASPRRLDRVRLRDRSLGRASIAVCERSYRLPLEGRPRLRRLHPVELDQSVRAHDARQRLRPVPRPRSVSRLRGDAQRASADRSLRPRRLLVRPTGVGSCGAGVVQKGCVVGSRGLQWGEVEHATRRV